MSTLVHPTVFGSFLVGIIHFSYFIFSEVKKIYKPLIIFIIIILLSAVISSFSRGNLFALIVSTVIYFYFQKKIRYIKFIILGVFILFFFSSFYLKNNFSFNRFSFNSLISYWWETELDNLNIVKKIFKEHPLVGIGTGNYRIKFEVYITDRRKNIEKLIKKYGYDPREWRTPDNMYLCILAENGLLGFGCFIIFLFLIIKKAIFNIKTIQDQITKNFLVACLCGTIGLLISMNTYDLFYWLNPTLLFWFLIAHLRILSK
jgi:O-antigen ligase